MNNTKQYREQVRLLLRILPLIYQEEDFAVHGGTAINLFVNDLPRYSVDIDLTYIPVDSREESLRRINETLAALSDRIRRAVPGIVIRSVPNKLLCSQIGSLVKIEVNSIKRGIIGDTMDLTLCPKAQSEFSAFCKARIVSIGQLYGGKIAAALSRQHPRDLFDCKYMAVDNFQEIRQGLIFNLLSSDKPIVESLNPHMIDQSEALENQFKGMTEIPFGYEDYEQTRQWIIRFVNKNLTDRDRSLLLSFEQGTPDWGKSEFEFLQHYPSIQWKLLNIAKLKKENPRKHQQTVDKLDHHFGNL